MKEGYFLLVVSLASVLASRYAQVHTDLEHAHGELLVLDKMKDDFMATTSHELRTPLHGIMGLSETLLANKKDPLTLHQGETVGIIHQSARRLSYLVNDILDFSRLRAQRVDLIPGRVKLGETLRGLVSLAKGMTREKTLELSCNIAETLPDIVADKHRLEQVILNLLGNAVKFTDRGCVELSAHGKDGGVLIEVRDTGCGIPPDKVRMIWNPYEQADPAEIRRHGGSGLGLAITKHLVEMHGGTIAVDSTPGKGSVFALWLPLELPMDKMGISGTMPVIEDKPAVPEIAVKPTDEMPAAVVDGRAAKALRKDEIRILAVDDDPVNLKVAVEALSMEGYLVTTASSGPEALAAIGEEAPHCVLLDIMLPGMSGYEVAATIRESHHNGYLPIIMVTARSQAEDLTKGFLYGASDYITKPFNIRELLLRVENQLVIRNIVEMEKKVKSHLLVERDRIESNLLERSALLHEAVHKLSDWERIISEDLNIAKRFLGKLMTARVTAKEVEYALHFDPLHTIGGDVYDINEYTPGKIRIFMADATGHGINASLNTITIMTEYDLIRGELIPPAEILGLLNERFCKKLAQYRILFTCCIAEIDLFTGTIRFSSAGHPEQFLFGAGGGCIPLNPQGPIIGFRKGITFEEQLFEFQPGSLLFFYTDGLLEDDIPPRSGGRANTRTLRDDGYLRNVLMEHRDKLPVEELCKKVKTIMKGERYRKERLSDDDITMIAVRRR